MFKFRLSTWLLLSSFNTAAWAAFQQQVVFGNPLFFAASDSRQESELKAVILPLASKLATDWDPDCLWRQPTNSVCIFSPNENFKEISTKSAQYSKEIGHAFNTVALKNQKSYRDYGALSEGLFLDKTLSAFYKNGDAARQASFYLNFSGDLFIGPAYPGEKAVTIADPITAAAGQFAKIKLPRGGWVFTSGAKALSGEIRESKKIKREDRLLMISILGSPKMEGARLDAWATGIVAGGKNVIKRLEELEEFKGRWAYLAFEPNGKAFCSKNLDCSKLNENSFLKREIQFVGE